MTTNQQPNRRRRTRRGPQAVFYDAIADRRRPCYDRRGQDPLRTLKGATRPGVNEAAPRVERRRVPEGGSE